MQEKRSKGVWKQKKRMKSLDLTKNFSCNCSKYLTIILYKISYVTSLYISYRDNKLLHASIFHVKKPKKRLIILSSKPSQKIEDTVPLKLLFALSRYLDPLPRYKDLKFSYRVEIAQKLWMGSRPTDLHYFLETRTTFFQESRRLSAIWGRSARRGASERSELTIRTGIVND